MGSTLHRFHTHETPFQKNQNYLAEEHENNAATETTLQLSKINIKRYSMCIFYRFKLGK